MNPLRQQLIEKAKQTLTQNDMGGYTIPTQGLYPFQWNWDSAITALGFMTFDEPRAWQEIEFLLKGQWENGMVPHIIFHENSDSYFPGPDVWGASSACLKTQESAASDEAAVPSTAISQPPVLASVLRRLLNECEDNTAARQKIEQILPKVIAYHHWWYNVRDPKQTGLVVSYHPWESGMDNSPAWDEALAAVPAVDWRYQRRDVQHVDSDERPKEFEYDRYLYLVDFYKKNDFDTHAIYEHCPYKMYDMGIISILHRATQDLIAICESLSLYPDDCATLKKHLSLTETAVQSLWNDTFASFLNKNAITGEFAQVQTTGTLMALYAGFGTDEQISKQIELLEQWMHINPHTISSTFPQHERYEPQRYWRGPVWLHINWLLSLGLRDHGRDDLAQQVKQATEALITQSGYWEYFNADTGVGCGGDNFSWTAAISLYWLLNASDDE